MMVPLWVIFLPILLALIAVLFIVGDLLTTFVIDPWFARRAFPGLERSVQLAKFRELRDAAFDELEKVC